MQTFEGRKAIGGCYLDLPRVNGSLEVETRIDGAMNYSSTLVLLQVVLEKKLMIVVHGGRKMEAANVNRCHGGGRWCDGEPCQLMVIGPIGFSVPEQSVSRVHGSSQQVPGREGCVCRISLGA